MKLVKFLLAISLSVKLFASGDININVIDEDAKKTNKITMVFFHMTHCPYCNRMLEEMYEKEDAMSVINQSFYYVDINIDDDAIITYNKFKGTAAEFASYYDIKMYPTILFIDHGRIIYYVHGYRNEEKFNFIMKYVASRSVDKMDLLEFINEEMMKDDY